MQSWLSPAAPWQHPMEYPRLGMQAVGNPGFHYFNGNVTVLYGVEDNPKPPLCL